MPAVGKEWTVPSRVVLVFLAVAMTRMAFFPLVTAFCPTPSSPKQHCSPLHSIIEDPCMSSILIPRAQDALLSPKMARKIRHYRSSQQAALTFVVSSETKETNQKKPTNKRPRPTEATKRQNGLDLPYESTLQALQVYHDIHGDLVIPRRYMVPAEAPYPKEWHGVDLASTVYSMKWWIKHVKQKPDVQQELNRLGFVWERLQPEWNLVLEALVTYKTIYGDLLVPNKFVVPREDSAWTRATWGLALGSCVYRIRARNDFLRDHHALSRRDQLDRLGFVWDVHEYSFQKFYAALRHFAMLNSCGPYSQMNKAIRVPSTFVVPEDSSWPRGLWGYELGAKCTAVRQKELYVKGKPRRKQRLEEMGFRWNGNSDLGWLKVVHAAAIYSQLNGRKLDVPYNFVVPEPPSDQAEWPWPEHLWGLRLGQRLKDVRVKGAYLSGDVGASRRRQLDALGMNWEPKRGRRKATRIQ